MLVDLLGASGASIGALQFEERAEPLLGRDGWQPTAWSEER